ncbi:MAG: Ig-like domain-containing protein, partial [Methanobrevibacter sp.]
MLGSVCAADLNNVSDIENSNLIQDDNQLSYQNLEVSSNGSISDNYSYNFNGEYSGSGVIKSNYENNDVIGSQQISNNDVISEPQSSVSNTVLSGNDTTLYFKNGTTYDVKLTDITGKALANQTVSFLINGKLYNRTTGSDGVASMNINLVVGKYKITASYAGSSLYGSSSVTNLVEVLSTISANDVVKFYKNGTQYYAKFVDGNGNPLVNAEVRFNINGVFYTRNTNGSGIAKLNIALYPDKYILTAYHPNGEAKGYNITVLSTINSSDIIKYFRNGTQYYATFYDGMGNPLINETVRFNINGVIYEKRTNDKGTANLTISLYPGNYILTAYHPNGEAKGYNISVLTTLIDNKDIDMYYRDGTAFAITVLDGQGKPLANAAVRFNVNGVFYDKITDENGIAKLGIRLYPNNYIITSSYNGLEVSNRINVSSSNTTIIGKDAYVIMDSINSNYTVTLVDVKGNPIGNKTVYFRYDNKQVTATTDKNGNA